MLYTIFFVVLAVGFYFVLVKVIPGFDKKGVAPISFIRPFNFTNQDGKAFTEKDVAGKVFVSEYFYTTCPGICREMNDNMRLVYDQLKDEKDFLILSHTCDPDTDSIPVMKAYATKMDVNTDKWVFLTGRKDSLYNMARVSYTIDDPNDNLVNMEDDFMHSQLWALVDRNGDVRKIYDGLKEAEVRQLIVDAKGLLAD